MIILFGLYFLLKNILRTCCWYKYGESSDISHPKNSDLWIEILKLLGDIENIVDVTNAELDDYTIISIKDKTKIKQKDLFDLLKICKIDFHMQN